MTEIQNYFKIGFFFCKLSSFHFKNAFTYYIFGSKNLDTIYALTIVSYGALVPTYNNIK